MRNIALFTALLLFGTIVFTGAAKAQSGSAPPSTNVTKEQIDAAKNMYDNMTPEQKALLAQEVKKQAATLTPEQKAAMLNRAKAHFATLSPQERVALTSRLLQLGSLLTPEERAAYLKELNQSANQATNQTR